MVYVIGIFGMPGLMFAEEFTILLAFKNKQNGNKKMLHTGLTSCTGATGRGISPALYASKTFMKATFASVTSGKSAK